MNFVEIGNGDKPRVVFAHGWARTHVDFIPIAESLETQTKSLLVDLPAFGETPRPDGAWTTLDYANHVAEFIRAHTDGPVIWVGHSFGGRVGLRLAVHHPDLIAGLILLGCAGIPARRSPWQKLRSKLRQAQFRFLRRMAKNQSAIEALEARFGSADYVASRLTNTRDIFLNAVREDQSADMPRIAAKTVLLYGENDSETPPELGRRIGALIPGAEFQLLPEFDHLSVLYRGRHVVALRIKEMLQGFSK